MQNRGLKIQLDHDLEKNEMYMHHITALLNIKDESENAVLGKRFLTQLKDRLEYNSIVIRKLERELDVTEAALKAHTL